MFSYFSSITVWPLLLVSSTIIFSSSGSRTWGADSLREPVVKINYEMSNSQIPLEHFKDYSFIHCMIHPHDQGIPLSISPFPLHMSCWHIFYFWNHSLTIKIVWHSYPHWWHNSRVIDRDVTLFKEQCTI